MRASLDRSTMSFNGNLSVFKEMVRVSRLLFGLNQRNGLQQDCSIFQANSKSSTIFKKNIHLYFFDVSFSQFTLVYDNFEENFEDESKYRWPSIKCLPWDYLRSNHKTVKISF